MVRGKIIIYQVLPRLFGNAHAACTPNGDISVNGCGKLSDFTVRALQSNKRLGITHVWYTGVLEHATQTGYAEYGIRLDHPAIVKGKAGSPYAIKDYYDIDPDLADDVPQRMKEFEHLVHRTKQQGLGVIMDFVPNHVARQYYSDVQPERTKQLGADDDDAVAFNPNNNFYYLPNESFRGHFDLLAAAADPYTEHPARATGNDCFTASPHVTDWYDTVKLNYGVDYEHDRTPHFELLPDTWLKMRDILLFWADKGIDGFRCDMVEMVPVDFWEWVIPQIKSFYPHLLFIGEVYNPSLYHAYVEQGRFDYLYDKVGLYDTLRSVTCGYASATCIANAWQSLNGLEQRMVNFLENHDEQRLASDYYAGEGRRGIPALIAAACMNTNPLLIYFGQEFGEHGMDAEGFSGQDGRTSIFDYWSVSTIRRWRDKGTFEGTLLDTHERELQQQYVRILNLCLHEKTIGNGQFFDLTYVNKQGWKFNEHKQYAFLRKYKHEVLLVVVNFDSIAVNVAVNLPSHAFDFLQIPPIERIEARDLLSDATETISFLPYQATETHVDAYGGKLLKFTLSA
ncbi:MAG: alpha-amylase family protein [Prevotellaceae bacterium]|jgi:glycosidase|nr:alpha-amylase family protein [Prevotellaceae bacterium]